MQANASKRTTSLVSSGQDTEGGKHLKGEPVKDLLGLLMHRLQQEHVIKKRK